MTVEEARVLNKGDYIFYNNLEYKVLHSKEHRKFNNEVFIEIKCRRGNEILWLVNSLIDSAGTGGIVHGM